MTLQMAVGGVSAHIQALTRKALQSDFQPVTYAGVSDGLDSELHYLVLMAALPVFQLKGGRGMEIQRAVPSFR